jgi:uncharacterized protein
VDPASPWFWAALLGTGLIAGYASTLLGIGGGLVVVPLLHYLLGLDFAAATAVSLVAMAIQTPVGLWTHHRRGAVDWRMGGWLAAGGLVGVAVGEWLQPQMDVAALKLLFAAVLVAAAWRLWVRLREAEVRPIGWPPLLLLGLAAGVLSRLLGIGGGLVTVPVLVLLGTAVHRAVGTSLLPVLTNAAVATAWILAAGLADWRLAMPVAAGALLTSWLGTRTAHAMQAPALRRTFAMVLAAAAAYIAATSGAFRP